jgi:hypothetical protein
MPSIPATLAAAALLAAAPPAARAESAAGCHCFRDRTFEPDRPAAADPYILATTRSSLLSAAFGPSKRELVQAVMTGTPAEDLWIAHWAAARTGRRADELLGAKEKAESWKAALAGVRGLGEPFSKALAAGGDPRTLAALAVDDTLVARMGAKPEGLRALRAAGASTEETVLAAVIEAKTGEPVRPLVVLVQAGRVTWGSVLRDAGIAPKELDAIVRALVRGR